MCARVLGALACEFITTIHHCTQRKEFNYGRKKDSEDPRRRCGARDLWGNSSPQWRRGEFWWWWCRHVYINGWGGGQTKTLKKVFSEICKTNPDMTNRDMTNIEVYRKKNLCHDCKCYCWTFNEQTLENKRHLIAVVSAIK